MAASYPVPILYLQTLFLFSCLISFDLLAISWWSKSVVPIVLINKLKLREYNSFSKRTPVVRGSGMQNNKKWHLSLQALHMAGALEVASAGRHVTDWVYSCFPCTLPSHVSTQLFFLTGYSVYLIWNSLLPQTMTPIALSSFKQLSGMLLCIESWRFYLHFNFILSPSRVLLECHLLLDQFIAQLSVWWSIASALYPIFFLLLQDSGQL